MSKIAGTLAMMIDDDNARKHRARHAVRPHGYAWNLGAGGCGKMVILTGSPWMIAQNWTVNGLVDGHMERITRADAAEILREIHRERIEWVRVTEHGVVIA